MIQCIFTVDYEIYGNGEGSLTDLVYEPTQRLLAIFRKWGARFVTFVEAAELETLEGAGTDPCIGAVTEQLRGLHREGFEIGLHLHPQWYNGRFEGGGWRLDFDEYNLCTLRPERIAEIVDRSIAYLRKLIDLPAFTPLSFRAGNWLFQPSVMLAKILADRGIRVDSSVFKGGLQRRHNLDYRRALRNGSYWYFSDEIDVPQADGTLLELPIYSEMVPFWKMRTAKRIELQRKSHPMGVQPGSRLSRVGDLLRFRYPLKLDFCRMEEHELTRMLDGVINRDRVTPESYRPIVAIGHTKDLRDVAVVDSFLSYLQRNGIPVSTFSEVHLRCSSHAAGTTTTCCAVSRRHAHHGHEPRPKRAV